MCCDVYSTSFYLTIECLRMVFYVLIILVINNYPEIITWNCHYKKPKYHPYLCRLHLFETWKKFKVLIKF